MAKTIGAGILKLFQKTGLGKPAARLLEFFRLTEQPSLARWLLTHSDDLSSVQMILSCRVLESQVFQLKWEHLSVPTSRENDAEKTKFYSHDGRVSRYCSSSFISCPAGFDARLLFSKCFASLKK